MNKRAAVSVQSIKQNILAEPPEGLLYFAIFGSQVRGTERPDSDLDILYVVKTPESLPHNVIRNTVRIPGGVKMATIIQHTCDEELLKDVNVYGTIEYSVLRGYGSRTLYRSAEFNIPLHDAIDYANSARGWLKAAEVYMFSKTIDSESQPRMVCFYAWKVIDHILRANLCMQKIKFPFARDLHVLYNLLPAGRRPPLDIDVIATIPDKYFDNESDWSQDEACMVAVMAKQAYKSTEKMINSKNV